MSEELMLVVCDYLRKSQGTLYQSLLSAFHECYVKYDGYTLSKFTLQ